MDSTSFPSDLVNKSCIGFVYQFRLMSKDSVDTASVCLDLRKESEAGSSDRDLCGCKKATTAQEGT